MPNNIVTAANVHAANQMGDRGSMASDMSQMKALDSPSTFQKRFAAYKNTQNDFNSLNNHSFGQIDPSTVNTMIQRKPKNGFSEPNPSKPRKRSKKKKAGQI